LEDHTFSGKKRRNERGGEKKQKKKTLRSNGGKLLSEEKYLKIGRTRNRGKKGRFEFQRRRHLITRSQKQ